MYNNNPNNPNKKTVFVPSLATAEDISLVPAYRHNLTKDITYIKAKDWYKDTKTGKIIIGTQSSMFEYIENDELFKSSNGILAHKIMSLSLIELAKKNLPHRANINDIKLEDLEIRLSVKDIASFLGRKKLTASQLRETRRDVSKACDLLYGLSVEQENKYGKFKARVISTKAELVNGYYVFDLSRPMVEYAIQQGQINNFDTRILAIPSKEANTYILGYHISDRLHFKYTNGSTNKFKVNSLLNLIELQDIAEIREKGRSWRERIKTPLEKSLDKLRDEYNIIAGWEYYDNKEPLKKSKESSLEYEEWSELVIHFELEEKEEDQ